MNPLDCMITGIEGYQGYLIQSNGIVIGKRMRKPLISWVTHRGYTRIQLSEKGNKKFRYVHVLVASAFIPNLRNAPQVNHKDGDKSNNDYSNLEWCTSRENIDHAFNNNLHSNPRYPIIATNIEGIQTKFSSVREAGIRLNISRSFICRVLDFKGKTAKGYTFERDKEGVEV